MAVTCFSRVVRVSTYFNLSQEIWPSTHFQTRQERKERDAELAQTGTSSSIKPPLGWGFLVRSQFCSHIHLFEKKIHLHTWLHEMSNVMWWSDGKWVHEEHDDLHEECNREYSVEKNCEDGVLRSDSNFSVFLWMFRVFEVSQFWLPPAGRCCETRSLPSFLSEHQSCPNQQKKRKHPRHPKVRTI